MLSHNTAVATIAVRDMDRARQFYEGKLHLKPVETMDDGVVTYETGDSNLFVYKSKYAGGYGATVATWMIDHDIEGLVKELRDNGIRFEHYNQMGDAQLKGDIHVDGSMKMAWFKDPDGNIIAMVSEEADE